MVRQEPSASAGEVAGWVCAQPHSAPTVAATACVTLCGQGASRACLACASPRKATENPRVLRACSPDTVSCVQGIMPDAIVFIEQLFLQVELECVCPRSSFFNYFLSRRAPAQIWPTRNNCVVAVTAVLLLSSQSRVDVEACTPIFSQTRPQFAWQANQRRTTTATPIKRERGGSPEIQGEP